MFRDVREPDFNDPAEPHRVLANLNLPVYVTTNYDDFMVKALARHHRQPNRVLCQWNWAVEGYVSGNPTVFERILCTSRQSQTRLYFICTDTFRSRSLSS